MRALRGDGGGANQFTFTTQGTPLKNARERMDVIAAYRDVGSFRGAAAICGTTHKTVKRIVEAHEAASRGVTPAGRALLHHCHTVITDGDSYRMKQARAKGGTRLNTS